MKNLKKKMKNILMFMLLLILFSCKEKVRKLPYYDTADFTPKWEMGNAEYISCYQEI